MKGTMKTILLTSVTLKPKESIEIELEDGYEEYLVFYPVVDSLAPYLNMRFLDAELGEWVTDPARHSIKYRNADETFEHELWIIQFDHPLPPIFKIEPWQILLKGKVEK